MAPRATRRALAVLIGLASCSAAEPDFQPVGLALTAIAVANDHGCGLTADGRAHCWGDSLPPVAVPGGHLFKRIAVGTGQSCAIATDGRAYCWRVGAAPAPVADREWFAQISVGSQDACGITTDGAVYCWGPRGGRSVTTPASAGLGGSGGVRFVSLGLGDQHGCALAATGDAYCWGNGANGELGNGARDRSAQPVRVTGSHRFTALAVGDDHACGITAQGVAHCWGRNRYLELGREDDAGGCIGPCSPAPVEVIGPAPLTSIAAGEWRTCGLTAAGALLCWGARFWQEYQDGGNAAAPGPVAQAPPLASLVMGGERVCGTSTTGEALCWSAALGLPPQP